MSRLDVMLGALVMNRQRIADAKLMLERPDPPSLLAVARAYDELRLWEFYQRDVQKLVCKHLGAPWPDDDDDDDDSGPRPVTPAPIRPTEFA